MVTISVITDDLISKALRVASLSHKGQTRKGKDIPYIIHPVEVAMILQKEDINEEVIVAGLLHDILEDTDVEEEEIKDLFNNRILELVRGASEKLKNRNNTPWEERKQHTINYLKTANKEIKCIACADKLSNAKSMLRDYNEVGEKLWDRFNEHYDKQKWYYINLVDSLKKLQGMKMYEELKSVVGLLFD